MAVYTETRTYHTKAHMGMIDVTEDFRHAVEAACREKGISAGTITGFTTGGVAALTTLEYEPGLVGHDLKAALDVFSPYQDEKGRVIPYRAVCAGTPDPWPVAESDAGGVRHP